MYHYLVKSYRFTLIIRDKLDRLEKTFPVIPTLPWFANFLAHMRVSLTKQQGRAAHNTQKARTTHNAKGGLGSGLCYGHKEGCAMCAISNLGKTGKYTHLVGRSWKIPLTYLSLIPGVVFSSYGCLDNGTWDNVPK